MVNQCRTFRFCFNFLVRQCYWKRPKTVDHTEHSGISRTLLKLAVSYDLGEKIPASQAKSQNAYYFSTYHTAITKKHLLHIIEVETPEWDTSLWHQPCLLVAEIKPESIMIFKSRVRIYFLKRCIVNRISVHEHFCSRHSVTLSNLSKPTEDGCGYRKDNGFEWLIKLHLSHPLR